ncbi:MAG TPA: PEP-CTERM sorting domain-containing protein [Phycisphaerae bacterium]|nr:PEP-CTERM sorting domain-containing protein [Phycisphaerae bacterium]
MRKLYTAPLIAAVLAACASVRAAEVSVTWAPPGNENDWTDSAAWGLASGYPDNDHPPGTTYAVTLKGATTINGISPTIDSLIFHGALTGTGELTVNGPITWKGGDLGLVGGVTVDGGTIQWEFGYANALSDSMTNAAGGTLTIGPADDTTMLALQSGATLVNNGTVVLQTGTVTLGGSAPASAASFVNNGTLVVQDHDGPSAALANSIDGGYGTFQNDGVVDVQTGTFDVEVNPAAATPGAFNVSAGATLVLGQPHMFASTAQLTGAGLIDLAAASLTNVYEFEGPINFGGTLSTSGPLQFDDAATVANLNAGSYTQISGAGSLTLTGVSKLDIFTSTLHSFTFGGTTTLTASAGGSTFDGTAAAIASGGTVTMQGIVYLKNHATFTNNGVLTGYNPIFEGSVTAFGASGTFTNNGIINASFSSDAYVTFNNNGTLILGNQSAIYGPGTDGPNSYIHNRNGLLSLTAIHPFLAGTLQTDGYVQVSLPTGSSTTLGSGLTFKHIGTLDVYQGTLILAAAQDPATTGLFQVDAAGILDFAASYDFSMIPTLTGSGTVIVDPGVTLTVPEDVDFTGTIEVNGTLVIAPPRDPNASPDELMRFSVIQSAVPEPASFTLLALGAGVLIRRRKTRRG